MRVAVKAYRVAPLPPIEMDEWLDGWRTMEIISLRMDLERCYPFNHFHPGGRAIVNVHAVELGWEGREVVNGHQQYYLLLLSFVAFWLPSCG